uniref:Uncharacterized protein n=1 Tax=Arundo donax TaxID=35708 RepID=A0A0A8Z510_ARUDO
MDNYSITVSYSYTDIKFMPQNHSLYWKKHTILHPNPSEQVTPLLSNPTHTNHNG